MSAPDPTARAPQPSGGLGLGTFLAAGVMIAGAFFGLKWWEAKQAPPPEPSFEPAASAAALAKPGALPGAPRKEEPSPGDSLTMVKTAEDYRGLARPGPMANSRPEPPLSYTGDRGPARPSTRVIRSKKEWDALWVETGGHDMPVVDFERYTGLAAFAGLKPAGTKVQFVSANAEGGRLEARWRAVPPRAAEPGTANPFAVVLVPRTTAAISFREVR